MSSLEEKDIVEADFYWSPKDNIVWYVPDNDKQEDFTVWELEELFNRAQSNMCFLMGIEQRAECRKFKESICVMVQLDACSAWFGRHVFYVNGVSERPPNAKVSMYELRFNQNWFK